MRDSNDFDIFVPSFPTIWPSMLVKPAHPIDYPPFCSRKARYFYFARNAIWKMVKMLGLEQCEILVPAYHHGVEIEALIDAGAKVKFYRVGSKWDVDLDDVAAKIGPETRALYLTHFCGFPGPVREMKELARENNLYLIEDCALSLFSKDGDRPLGETGDVAIFCLYKIMALPHGGALVINMKDQFDLPEPSEPPFSSTFSLISSLLLRNLALRGGKIGQQLRRLILRAGKFTLRSSNVEPVLVGSAHFNHDHLDFGISRISKHIASTQDVESIIETRRRNYLYALDNLSDISPPLFDSLPEGVAPLCYPMIVEDNRLMTNRMVARGIEADVLWGTFHPACDPSQFPEVAKLRQTILEIPCHQDITPEMMTKIVAATREELKEV